MGHVLGAAATGGKVAKVVLHPLTISRTDLAGAKPALVVWAGPTVGYLLPLALLAVFKVTRLPGAWMVQFFAGACLVANGAYLGAGSLGGIADAGDAGDLIRLGCPMWQLWLFAAITFPLGLALWNNLGLHFGLGEARGKVEPMAAYASCALLVLVVVVEVILSPMR